MSEIRNLTRNGETFYPLTHVDAIVSNTGAGIDEEPTPNSDNPAKSGGIHKADYITRYNIIASGNLYNGIEYDGVYLDWGTGEQRSFSTFGISYEIPVSEGEVLTFNEHHSILFYDSSHSYTHKCFTADGPNTIVVPNGSVYMRCNINKEWSVSIIINRGTSANDAYRHSEKIKDELLPEGFDVYVPAANESTKEVFDNITRIGKKVILLLKNNVIINNYYTSLPSNLYKVVGLGGTIIPYGLAADQQIELTFPYGCIFECSLWTQMFDKRVICKCSDGFLLGEACPVWWGAQADRLTDDNMAISSMSKSWFKTLRFIAGVYRAYFNNEISGRTLIFEEGVIFDGVVHIAYGDITNKTFCKDTKVIGKVVSTIRVGGAYIDGLYIPNGIKVLKNDPTWPNQSAKGEGTAGVHFNYCNKNIYISDILVEEVANRTRDSQSLLTFGLGIDGQSGHENPSNINIESLTISTNSSDYYDVWLVSCNNINIKKVICGDGNRKNKSLYLGDLYDVNIGDYEETTTTTNSSYCHIGTDGNNVKQVFINRLRMHGSGYGMKLANAGDIVVNDFFAENLVEALSVTNCNRVFIQRFRTTNCTTDINNTGSTLDIIKNYNT